jgi:protein-S-isoprenylcysteine O-methyltransferase Ste14
VAADTAGAEQAAASPEPGPEGECRRSFFVRRRTLFSLLFPVALVVLAKPILWWFLAGVAALVLGQMTRLWAAGAVRKDEELTTAGPYGYVRNPLYVGSLLMAIGYCLMSGRWWSFVALAVLFAAFYLTTVLDEERRLSSMFGQDFEQYRNSVPRFRPRLRRWSEASGAFSLAQAQANREHVSMVWSGLLCLAFAARSLLPLIW